MTAESVEPISDERLAELEHRFTLPQPTIVNADDGRAMAARIRGLQLAYESRAEALDRERHAYSKLEQEIERLRSQVEAKDELLFAYESTRSPRSQLTPSPQQEGPIVAALRAWLEVERENNLDKYVDLCLDRLELFVSEHAEQAHASRVADLTAFGLWRFGENTDGSTVRDDAEAYVKSLESA